MKKPIYPPSKSFRLLIVFIAGIAITAPIKFPNPSIKVPLLGVNRFEDELLEKIWFEYRFTILIPATSWKKQLKILIQVDLL